MDLAGQAPIETTTHHFSYDPAGRLLQARTPDSLVQFSRDALGRITEESFSSPGLGSGCDFKHTLRHRYGPLGQRQSTHHPFAGEVDYLSYGPGHVHQIALNQQALVDFERDALHRETARTLFTGDATPAPIEIQRHLDRLGRLSHSWLSGGAQPHPSPHQSPSLSDLNRSYHYDPVGLLQCIDLPPWRSQHFAYDSARRLTSALHYQQNPPRPNQAMEQGPGQLRQSQTHHPSHHPSARSEQRRITTVHHHYDALGRRYRKRSEQRTAAGEQQVVQDTFYGWDGDRLVTTHRAELTSTVIYEPESFMPLLRVDRTGVKHKTAALPLQPPGHAAGPDRCTSTEDRLAS